MPPCEALVPPSEAQVPFSEAQVPPSEARASEAHFVKNMDSEARSQVPTPTITGAPAGASTRGSASTLGVGGQEGGQRPLEAPGAQPPQRGVQLRV